MTATTDFTIYQGEANGVKDARGFSFQTLRAALILTEATVDDGDTVALARTDINLTTPGGQVGYTHSTADSIVITEAPTTSDDGTTKTLTVGGATDDKARAIVLFYV